MLHLLETLLKNKALHIEEEIGKIAHSCCNTSKVKVLDFDKIKDEFCNTLNVKSPLKSVDAIYLSKTQNVIYLIEMKNYSTSGVISGINMTCEEFINFHFGKNSIGNKIIDSIFIIFGLMGYHNISKTFYPFFLDEQKLKIKTFFLTNFNHSDIVSLSLATLDKQRIGLTKRIEGETLIINCDGFETLMQGA